MCTQNSTINKLENKIQKLIYMPLFASLSRQELQAIAQVCSAKEYPQDNVIIIENEILNRLFFISSGRVKISQISPFGQEI